MYISTSELTVHFALSLETLLNRSVLIKYIYSHARFEESLASFSYIQLIFEFVSTL